MSKVIAEFEAYVCSFKSGRGDLRIEMGLSADQFDAWSKLARTAGLTIALVAFDSLLEEIPQDHPALPELVTAEIVQDKYSDWGTVGINKWDRE